MSFIEQVSNESNMTVDVRAARYDSGRPRLVTTFLCSSLTHAWSMVDAASERPVAIVKEDGSALITSAGGSGHIWVIGESVNGKQQAMVDRLREILISLGGAAVYSDPLPSV